MSRLSDVNNGAIRNLLANRNTIKGVLAINAASAATVKTTAALAYTVDGVLYSKAALSAQSIAVTHNWQGNASTGYVQPIGKTAYYTIGLNSAGTVCVVQGSYAGQVLSNDPTVGVGQAVAGATWVGDGSMPDVPAGYTAIGIIKVVATSATFTAGTTLLDVGTITVSYFDVEVMPSAAL